MTYTTIAFIAMGVFVVAETLSTPYRQRDRKPVVVGPAVVALIFGSLAVFQCLQRVNGSHGISVLAIPILTPIWTAAGFVVGWALETICRALWSLRTNLKPIPWTSVIVAVAVIALASRWA